MQYPGALGCISEDGSGGRCADGVGLAGVTSVATGPGGPLGHTRVYAVSPSQSTLVVFDADMLNGGLRQLQCLSAVPRAGCTVARALRGAIDVAADIFGRRVYVAARDDDAVAAFECTDAGLSQLAGTRGCVALALAGCKRVPALDEPVAIAADWSDIHVVSRRSQAVLRFNSEDPSGSGISLTTCLRSGPDATADGCRELRGLVDPVDIATTGSSENFVVVRDGVVASRAAYDFGDVVHTCANATGDFGCARIPSLRGARHVAAFTNFDSYGSVYVSEPGSASVQALRYGLGKGFGAEAGLSVAAPGPLALLPWVWYADAGYAGGSHLYAGGNELLSLRRSQDGVGALEPSVATARFPPGRIEGVATSPEPGASTAIYAAVPSAGAIIALRRNRPPECQAQVVPVRIRMLAATPVALSCHDWDGGPLAYTVESPPAVGSVVGFSGGAALYEGPTSNHARRPDSFSVRVSDGSESALVKLNVFLAYTSNGPIALRLLDTRMRMDKRGRIRLRVRCVSESKTCVARLIAYHGRPIAFGKATLPSGQVRRMRLRLPTGIRRSVRRHRKGVVIRVDATANDAGGGTGQASLRLRVRR